MNMYKMHRGQKGITGLETAIILIAFVVVAAVFAYTALSAGLFSTQKSSEAVYSGLKEARSTMELKGAVVATANTTGATGTIKQVSFIVSNVLGGEGIDFTAPTAGSATGLAAANSDNKVVISYIDQDQKYNDLYWTITKLGDADADNLLEQNEKFEVVIGSATAGSGAGNLIDALGTDLTINKTFTIEVKPPVGAVLNIERTTPPYIDTIMNLH
ncbi:MAG: archaellin/type IV pilin N-terminal domain-containing protein [Chloroflexota bacterium]